MAKGVKTGGGSRKGIPNKVNLKLYEMIDMALVEVGGVDYLRQQAIDNPVAFMSLVGKRLPREVKTEISGANGGPLVTQIQLVAMHAGTDRASG